MSLPDLPRFFVPEAVENSTCELLADEAQHARVLRLKNGDSVHVFNGKGKLFTASIFSSGKKSSVNISDIVEEQSANLKSIILLVAPTKNIARFEWVIEKSIEIGVNKIIPIQCQHSERSHIKHERLMRIAISAAKQSKDLFIPDISELIAFEKAIVMQNGEKWIAHCAEGEKASLKTLQRSSANTVLAIGPEGDFSSEEIRLANAQGYQPLSLGKKRLRTETAAIVGVMVAALLMD
ncbi:MAG: RsmE family RNA methyltransferase [Salibacteraceae bacterium]